MAKLDKKLERAFTRAAARVEKLLDDKVRMITSTAQANAPVVTGALRRSIRYSKAGDLEKTGRVEYGIVAGGAEAPYAALVEFGVGRLGEASLGAEGHEFLPPGWSFGAKTGFPGRLYMTRAYFTHARDLEAEVNSTVEEEVRKALEA